MADIRVDVDYTIADGAELLFYAPCDFANISGLKVYYPGTDAGIVSHEFSFKDAHKNDLSNLDNLFAEGACVKVILSVTNSTAYIQNADTNAYLEGRFDAIIDGTTQVGNAKTLDGHGEEYFAPKTDLANHSIPLYTVYNEEELLNKLAEIHENAKNNSLYEAKLNLKYTGKPLEVGGVWSLEGFRDDSLYGWQRFGYYSKDNLLKARALKNGVWGDVQTFATLSDLAKYLPLMGGSIEGYLYVFSGSDSSFRLYGASGDSSDICLYDKNRVYLGRLGINGVDKPTYTKADGTRYNILHTGNKPTGTYTGNGSATERKIAIGGIGNVVAVWSANGFALCTPSGAITRSPSGGVSQLSSDEVKPLNGYLNLATTNNILNGNGIEVTYAVL